MADYFGAHAIAERMGVHEDTIAIWRKERGFLCYHRWNNKTKRKVWYTNDTLILCWEREQCAKQAKGLRRRKRVPEGEPV